MDLKHKSVMMVPNIKEAKEEGTRNVFTQLVKHLNDMFKNIYDDLIKIRPERVSALPTAAAENLGRFYLLINGGADDTLHICIYDGAASGYKFQQITLS